MCRCPPGFEGNPYAGAGCRPEPKPECTRDADCPSTFACMNERCGDPCAVHKPCSAPARCTVVPDSLPVRTMICKCPEGYVSSGNGVCKTIPPFTKVGCVADTECPSDKACFNSVCRDPCNCGTNADCRVAEHRPICTCKVGFEGNPEIQCTRVGCLSDDECSGKDACLNQHCVPVCKATSCGDGAICYGVSHKPICECPPGFQGNPKVACTAVGCRSDSECPSDKACYNAQCQSPCAIDDPCIAPSKCLVYDHKADCSCPPGFLGNKKLGCEKSK
jgi:hypothetical protein